MSPVVELGTLDLALCGGYLVSVLLVGLFFTFREQRAREKLRLTRLHHQALMNAGARDSKHLDAPPSHSPAKNDSVLEEYYLGGRRIPWYALAVADVSSYIDISGTMINTALVYALGVKGMYIEIRGGLCLFLAFQLAYTGKLSRRCPVKTRGEWCVGRFYCLRIKFRFGTRFDAMLLRTTIAVTSLTSGVLATTYFAVGGGKFFTEFVKLPEWCGLPSEFWAAALLMAVAMLYTVASGFSTVVYTDVYQSLFIFTSFIIVAIMGFMVQLPERFSVFLPGKAASYSMYNSFTLILVSYSLLQMMRSASGPGGSGLQTVLATKSEREVRSQTFLAMMFLSLRWAFSGGIAVMGIHYSMQHAGVVVDPERVVPIVINKMLPVGAKGFVLASLLAAALTTFDTTINSSSSYWTVDIYQALINPKASERQLLWQARLSSVFVMLAGLFLSLDVSTINRIWGFTTIAMAGGLIWPFFFSWYWARFNAYSCLLGISSGYMAAFAVFIFAPLLEEFRAFVITSSISGVISVVVCLLTRPEPDKVLKRFYRYARPPGAWHKIKHICFTQEEVISEIDSENHTDLACTGLIVIAQLALYILAVSAVAKAWTQSLILVGVLVVTLPLIYLKWYVKLKDRPVGLRKEELNASLLGPV
ncbi:Solute:Sodium Symporter (SSS) protein [Phytophthora megakarya]|uniref:Solute:Sodium Symporter (SSS) protein n=1 Tax=Phytophthora megakarya TaxID=4795 RepID=A0A225V8H1_9STRA|nr:Solute:Sodium Symporter (SSS) protein [Phytophthora megakarya]